MQQIHVLVTESCANLRLLGRQALKGKWGVATLVAMIWLSVYIAPFLIWGVFFGDMPEDSNAFNISVSFMYLCYFLLPGPVMLGKTIFFINLFRDKNVEVGQFFSGFHYFFKALGLMFMTQLFITLWSYLFLIPGIVAAIRYSQAFYILADDPSKSIMSCINESKWLMSGNKGKYFALSMSFIGWILLSLVTLSFVLVFAEAPFSDFADSTYIVVIIWGICIVGVMGLVTAYISAAQVAFYEILTSRLLPVTKDHQKKTTVWEKPQASQTARPPQSPFQEPAQSHSLETSQGTQTAAPTQSPSMGTSQGSQTAAPIQSPSMETSQDSQTAAPSQSPSSARITDYKALLKSGLITEEEYKERMKSQKK